MSYTEMTDTWMKLSRISERAKREPQFQFMSLAHLLNREFLKDCYKSLNRNKAVGIDNVSWEEYGKEVERNLDKLVDRMKRKKYKPIPSRRVYIPKDNKGKRALGSIYEEDFLDCSYGFRPKRNCHQAINRIDKLIMSKPVSYIVEADIKGFFDDISHEKLIEFLRIRIVDSTLLDLINKFLKAGYVDDGLLIKSDKGTTQGSILSPILANIFLHYVLDKWFNKVVKSYIKGFCEIVRYADDFICVVQYDRDAQRIEKALKNRFNKFGLEINPDKSKTFSFGRFERKKAKTQDRRANTFDFLGFTHFCDKTRRGNFKVGRRTSRKKFVKKCKEMNIWLKSIRNLVKTKEWWKILKSKLQGHFQYYGVSGNIALISKFYFITIRLLHKWLNRRSQKKKMNWEKFKNYLNHYPLPKPKIKHNLYTLSHKL